MLQPGIEESVREFWNGIESRSPPVVPQQVDVSFVNACLLQALAVMRLATLKSVKRPFSGGRGFPKGRKLASRPFGPSKPMARSKPMGRGHKEKATKEESERMDAVAAAGCIACMIQRNFTAASAAILFDQGGLVQNHHLLDDGGERRGHMFTIGLCDWHHEGYKPTALEGFSKEAVAKILGPSLANGTVPFHETYGTDDDLLAFENELLRHCRERARP